MVAHSFCSKQTTTRDFFRSRPGAISCRKEIKEIHSALFAFDCNMDRLGGYGSSDDDTVMQADASHIKAIDVVPTIPKPSINVAPDVGLEVRYFYRVREQIRFNSLIS